ILAAAELARTKKDPDEARKQLERAVKLFPQDGRIYLALATGERLANRRQEHDNWLRAGLKAVPDTDLDSILAMADLLMDAGEVQDVQATVERLSKTKTADAAVDYLRARLDIGEGRWQAASQKLETARTQLARVPLWTRKVDLLLARCHE